MYSCGWRGEEREGDVGGISVLHLHDKHQQEGVESRPSSTSIDPLILLYADLMGLY